MRQRGKERRELYGQRNLDTLFNSSHDAHATVLNLGSRDIKLGRQKIQVQLQCIRARFFDQRSVIDPLPFAGAVERADDRDRDRVLHPPELFKVIIQPALQQVHFREVGCRLGKRVLICTNMRLRADQILRDLLLEERIHGDRGDTAVFQPTHFVKVIGQR